MKFVRSKPFIFIFGLLIGLIIGNSLLWWNQSSKPIKFSFLKDFKGIIKQFLLTENYIDTLNDLQHNKNHLQQKKNQYKPELKKDSTTTFALNLLAENNFSDNISFNSTDSIAKDSVPEKINNISVVRLNEVSVIRDELIFEKNITLKMKSNIKNNKINVDSLLVDDHSSNTSENSTYKIEFWRSPVNYKGYKTGKNKIILFGLLQYQDVKFCTLDNNIYFQYQGKFYRVEPTTEFRPYISISDKKLIALLNSQINAN